jgi:GNAT superfamily N-acetyltransferase
VPEAVGPGTVSGVATIRSATARDADFLAKMLAVAVDWRPGTRPRQVASAMGEPALAHCVSDWPLEGDVGFVGVAADGRPLGAAWWRYFTGEDPGHGFVDPATPEVSIGVVTGARSRGLGTQLLQALIDEGRRRGCPYSA